MPEVINEVSDHEGDGPDLTPKKVILDHVYTCIYIWVVLLYEIADIFEQSNLKYAVVGGYAMALHGIIRATMDVDLVLSLTQADFELAEKVLNKIGLQSRLPIRAHEVFKMRKEYIENRNLIAWSFVDYTNPVRQVDILITKDLKKMETVRISVGTRKIPVASLNELLKMKSEAGRAQDFLDVEKIKEKLNAKK